jgi:flagellar biosynthesis regulator FlbT
LFYLGNTDMTVKIQCLREKLDHLKGRDNDVNTDKKILQALGLRSKSNIWHWIIGNDVGRDTNTVPLKHVFGICNVFHIQTDCFEIDKGTFEKTMEAFVACVKRQPRAERSPWERLALESMVSKAFTVQKKDEDKVLRASYEDEEDEIADQGEADGIPELKIGEVISLHLDLKELGKDKQVPFKGWEKDTEKNNTHCIVLHQDSHGIRSLCPSQSLHAPSPIVTSDQLRVPADEFYLSVTGPTGDQEFLILLTRTPFPDAAYNAL